MLCTEVITPYRRSSERFAGVRLGLRFSDEVKVFLLRKRVRNASLNRSAGPAIKDWVYGGEDFLKRLLAIEGGEDSKINALRVRSTKALSAQQIIGNVAAHYAVDASGFREFRSPAGGRDLAAYLCRRYSGVTLREAPTHTRLETVGNRWKHGCVLMCNSQLVPDSFTSLEWQS